MALQRCARDRHKGHHKGVDPEFNQPSAAVEQGLLAVTQAGQQIRGHFTATEHRNGIREGLVIALKTELRFPGKDPTPHIRLHHLQVHAETVNSRVLHALIPARIFRRFTLALDREIHPTLDGFCGISHQTGSAIVTVGRSGGHHQLLDPVQPDSRFRHFRHLLGRLAHQGPILDRLFNRAELARLGSIPKTNAGLQQRGGQHILAVQQGNRSVGDSVGCAQAVKRWFPWG